MMPFNLNILRLDQLLPVEKSTPTKIDSARGELLRTGHLASPLLVYRESGGKYLQLQDAHLFHALRTIGIEEAVVQEVSFRYHQADCGTWYHLVRHYKPEYLTQIAIQLGLQVTQENLRPEQIDCLPAEKLYCLFSDGQALSVSSGHKSAIKKAIIMNEFIESYQTCSVHLKLYPDYLFIESAGIFDDDSALIIPPQYGIREIERLAVHGVVFPCGYFSYNVDHRVIGLDFPLDVLKSVAPVGEKKAFLKELVRMRLQSEKTAVYGRQVFFLGKSEREKIAGPHIRDESGMNYRI